MNSEPPRTARLACYRRLPGALTAREAVLFVGALTPCLRQAGNPLPEGEGGDVGGGVPLWVVVL